MIIYKATNKVNNKCYIGQTINSLRERINAHHSPKIKYKLHNAISKYGRDSFEWDIICECSSISELNEKEIFYIDKYNSITNGYNIKHGGKNSVRSKESNLKTSESLKAFYKTPDGIEKRIRAKNHKPNLSKEQRKEIGRKIQLKHKDPEFKKAFKAKMIISAEKKRRGVDIICKICGESFYVPKWKLDKANGNDIVCSVKCRGITQQGVKFSEERKKKLSLAWVGRKKNGMYKNPEETKRKLSESVKRSWKNGRKHSNVV
tara:strand:- start:15 stop:797 length:783 start_codon:yes stop_codon:yes gene_type:complete